MGRLISLLAISFKFTLEWLAHVAFRTLKYYISADKD